MMTENQRIILGDAISTLELLYSASRLKDSRDRTQEIVELRDRIRDDIQTVLRIDKK